MADKDNKPPRDWGHHKSPFFKLPLHIRNKIYHETFSGSEASLVIDPPLDADARLVPATGRRSIFSFSNSCHNFLLTCFQIYLEALNVYWSVTVINNGCSGNLMFGHYVRGHFSRLYFLNRIPAIAKPYIQHLQYVDAGSFGPGLNRQQLSLAESLDQFPNLKSCLIRERSRKTDPSAPLACDQAIARHPHVYILEKKYSVAMTTRPVLSQGLIQPVRPRVIFLNRNTGKTISWVEPQPRIEAIPDKDCVKMLMGPVPNEIVQQLASMNGWVQ